MWCERGSGGGGWGEGPVRRTARICPVEADVTGVVTRAGLTALDDLIGAAGGLGAGMHLLRHQWAQGEEEGQFSLDFP